MDHTQGASSGNWHASTHHLPQGQFGRRPSPHTIQLVLASGSKPSRKERRFPLYAAFENPVQARLAIIRLHFEGWSAKSIAGYLGISRNLIYTTLKRWITEQFARLEDKSSRPHHPTTKTTLRAMQEVKKMQINPELGEYRVSAALEQIGIKLSPRTCGRIIWPEKKCISMCFKKRWRWNMTSRPWPNTPSNGNPMMSTSCAWATRVCTTIPTKVHNWPQDALEWFVIIKAVPYGSRPRRKRSTRILVIQSPLWTEEA